MDRLPRPQTSRLPKRTQFKVLYRLQLKEMQYNEIKSEILLLTLGSSAEVFVVYASHLPHKE